MRLKLTFEGYIEVDPFGGGPEKVARELEQWIDGGGLPLEEAIASCKDYSYKIEPTE